LLRLLRLKRDIILLRKSLVYEREVLARLSRGEFSLIDDRETVYYRNVYDHLVRFTELIESSREMVTDLMQTHLSATSNRLSEVMKALTTISTVILPMSLLAGIFGMNYRLFPLEARGHESFLVALGLIGLSGMASYLFFRWKKWI
jgi:magnesium transporter